MDTMWELAHVASLVGFDLDVRDSNHAVLIRDTWDRRFSTIEPLRDFLRAARAGQSLDWRACVTPFDAYPENKDYHRKQYASALELAKKGAIIHISASGSWSAEIPPEHPYQSGYSSLSSYEVIGGHACTAELVLGWQDGGAPIIDWRAVYA